MQLEVLNIQGQSTGRSVNLPDEIFGIEPHEHVVYLAVKQFLANQRQGTSKSKDRSEIQGSTRKLHRQKGTGGSRKGDINSPVFRGGARVHGPHPRDYTEKMPKKVKTLARKSVLSAKAQEGGIRVVEDFTFGAPKTQEYMRMLGSFNATDRKSILLLSDYDTNVFLSSRNIPNAMVIKASDFNVYDLLNSNYVFITESAVGKITEALS